VVLSNQNKLLSVIFLYKDSDTIHVIVQILKKDKVSSSEMLEIFTIFM